MVDNLRSILSQDALETLGYFSQDELAERLRDEGISSRQVTRIMNGLRLSPGGTQRRTVRDVAILPSSELRRWGWIGEGSLATIGRAIVNLLHHGAR